jgi:hypothetical protein
MNIEEYPDTLIELTTILLEIRNRMPATHSMQILFNFKGRMSVSVADLEDNKWAYKGYRSDSVYYALTKDLENSSVAVHIFFDKVCSYLVNNDLMSMDKINEIVKYTLI